MATVLKANKFFASHEAASHQGPECIHFAAFVPRSLSLADAKELRDVLTELLDEPKSPSAPEEPLVADEVLAVGGTEDKTVEVPEKPRRSWGKK